MSGLSHVTFICRDLNRMERVVLDVLKGEKVYDSGDATFSLSPERFYDVGGVWVAVMEGESLAERTYNHVAFKITEADFDARLAAIRTLGLDLREPRPRVEGEGRSIYFHDHDNHLFELHTGTLSERLARYAKRDAG
ncbi:FosX/FosE/FosI family fosfomycin resistance hydrolase [Jannaschia marina]|uniref:FosX/FosE/FosI family fosfomycin resistance hydrolase n=1 Tax=Jannaschia marina TaxID=2741674 RepID=UPI002E2CEB9F|nr:FosX/FosE/FosI family fosfomycin resistance hydrolase [Jannaschia marina]